MSVAVIVPTLGRPHEVARVTENVLATAPDARVVFVVEPHDLDTLRAIAHVDATCVINTRTPSYAGAVNSAVIAVKDPLLFIGADDLLWHDGWLPPLLEGAEEFGLVGCNDLHNPDVLRGVHATHYLVRRDYAVNGCIDAPGVLLHEGYVHNWCDTEVIATATARGQFGMRLDSIVEHRHWVWGLSSLDDTYIKGRDSEAADAIRFRERRHLWTQ